MNPMDRLWSLAAGILAVGLGAAAWFGVISPELAAASTARDDLEDVESVNAIHELRIVQLQEDMDRIQELRAERDDLAIGIPGEALYSDFLRDLDSMAAASSVVVEGVTSGDALAYLPPAAEEAAAAPTEPVESVEGEGSQPSAAEGSAAATGGADSAAPAATPEQPVDGGTFTPFTDPRIGADNLAAIPFTITASGDPVALEGFLQRLQGGPRIVSITTAAIGAGTAGADGAPAEPGSAQIVGYAYVLTTGSEAVAP